MAQKGRYYKVGAVGSGLTKYYPLREVRANMIVKCLEGAPKGSVDVVDVLLPSGKVKSVYSFQLEKVVKAPKWARK